ncbi:MAG: OB-fold domain-containing protein, partial [Acidimicrobiia bacterium]
VTPDARVSRATAGSVRIRAVGAAFPMLRLPTAAVASAWGRGGGRGQTSVCAPDEDVLTLSAEAAGRALVAADLEADAIDGLWWGTTRPPFAEGPSHAILAAAIGLEPNSGGALLSGSPHAGIEALLGAADALAAGTARTALVVAADALRPGIGTGFEARSGAGAAAYILTSSEVGPNPLADDAGALIGARVTRTHPFLDRYRGDGEVATRDVYDARLFREEIFLPPVREVGEHLAALEPRVWSLPDPDGRLGGIAAAQLGARGAVASDVVSQAIGDAGAAAALLGAIAGLDAAGTVAVVATGGGRTTGVTLVADVAVPGAATLRHLLAQGTETSYPEVLRARTELVPVGESVPMGVPPESAMFVRGATEMLSLLAGRCAECGMFNTPPSIHPMCLSCGGTKFDIVPLTRRGAVHTFVVNRTMPAPFVAPLGIAVIDLDDGARIMLQVVGDGSDLEIDGRVELVLRRYAHERGVPVYGLKVRSVSQPPETDGDGDPMTEEQ